MSDGIANELHKIAQASNVTITIEDDKIPIHPSLRVITYKEQQAWKYAGGEDFKLVATLVKKMSTVK